MAASILIIIGFVDLFIKLYFRIGGMVDADDLLLYFLSILLSVGEIGSGYAIFYRHKIGYLLGWAYAFLEIYVGMMAILNFLDIRPVDMDTMYIGNLFVGLIVVYALCKPEVRSYCFMLDKKKKQE